MKNFASLAALAVGANALVTRDNTCCFHLAASGGASGPIGQLDDGQNRVFGNLPEGEFCINSDGGIIDGHGRGCILTPPTTQFQCDAGAQPTAGFSVNAQGLLTYNGKTDFVACETGQNGGLNIYTSPNPNDVTGCKNIQLHADNCANTGVSSSTVSSSVVPVTPTSSAVQESTPATSPTPVSSAPGSTTTVKTTMTSTFCPESTIPAGSGSQPSHSASATQSSSPNCPTDLSGQYEFPHLIIPVDSSSPNKAPGTSFNGTVSSTVSSIFNFDIPSSDAGKTCSLVFLFPKKEDLETSSYSFSGDGKIDFAMLESAATSQTSFSNAPKVKQDYGVTTVSPGNSYLISTFQCPAGQAVGFEMKNAGSTNLNFFEDYNPAPLGLYITVC
ncbi:hypothetical protein KXW65_004535 [Aspergillus fumigatus]|uniref:GPI anchored cell wall protein n=1 Tax=Aspergillus fumigatus TaxID=746128 RepID=A0A9P8SQW4_ASPFM|nr:hypothetical protein KXX32_006640 [Aspergillus fumigatus]KAH1661568.1 hypothetical protein KXX65_003174 [Aspergillus fumigatus]KAH1815267.1 hypothetical protein KXX19_003939 [Aspergillus fumigatus]KAH1841244.1 hypothetical protein KXX54_002078 [Aspergillus fumigatus]KAH1897765.1 hypothetical protein KXV57_000554 [Aspergillus fumigatus]